MCAMADQNQTETLSLRISEALRKRLDDLRKLATVRKGESVSTSEVVKELLESARAERYEVAELLSNPTVALLEIRRKGEAGQMLSQPQWTALAYFVHQGVERFSKMPVSRESYVGVLKAFEAAYQFRSRPSGQDEYYMGNLPAECRPERGKADGLTPELVRRAVAETVRRVNNPAVKCTPMFSARNLYVLLDQEKLGGATALNDALFPYWSVLWRLAARGHFLERRQPVREPELDEPIFRPSIPAVHKNEFSLAFARGRGDDFDIVLGFPEDRKTMLPIGPYPKIAEFRTMLSELPKIQPPRAWDGEYFFAYPAEEKKELTFWMRAQGNGMTIGFSQSEWNTVQDLFRKAWENSELKRSWEKLSQDYGEL